jgi:hypothetical protein
MYLLDGSMRGGELLLCGSQGLLTSDALCVQLLQRPCILNPTSQQRAMLKVKHDDGVRIQRWIEQRRFPPAADAAAPVPAAALTRRLARPTEQRSPIPTQLVNTERQRQTERKVPDALHRRSAA